jgi:hypothetical protein
MPTAGPPFSTAGSDPVLGQVGPWLSLCRSGGQSSAGPPWSLGSDLPGAHVDTSFRVFMSGHVRSL